MLVSKTASEIAAEMRSKMAAQFGQAVNEPGSVVGSLIDVIAQSVEEQQSIMRLQWECMLSETGAVTWRAPVFGIENKCHCDWIKKVSEGYQCVDCDEKLP